MQVFDDGYDASDARDMLRRFRREIAD